MPGNSLRPIGMSINAINAILRRILSWSARWLPSSKHEEMEKERMKVSEAIMVIIVAASWPS